MEWEREEAAFMSVDARCRCRLPRRSSSIASSLLATGTLDKEKVYLFIYCLIHLFDCLFSFITI